MSGSNDSGSVSNPISSTKSGLGDWVGCMSTVVTLEHTYKELLSETVVASSDSSPELSCTKDTTFPLDTACLCSLFNFYPVELAFAPGSTTDEAGEAVFVAWFFWCANCKAGEANVRGIDDGAARLAGKDTSQQEQLETIAGFRLLRGTWKLIKTA
ncbi:hypothetical protein DPMN_165512 [Dreissena polymorpha]|uniref:Uncharacterized protein n=1 Tax=Dreissena polymorpha TaxID=45954 RepID=A0A9D4EWZ5_DREPO|nr:hypothetical protein DPMN_165512 [Dreissena polymorpha]